MSRSAKNRKKNNRWRGMSTPALRKFINSHREAVDRMQSELHHASMELRKRGDTSEHAADASADGTA